MLNLLERQIRKHFGDLTLVPENLRPFIETVKDTYRQTDEDREMLERSLELSSQELIQLNEKLDRRAQGIIDNAADAIITVDDYGVIKSLNPAAEELFGYRKEYIIGQNIGMLVYDLNENKLQNNSRKFLKNDETRSGTNKIEAVGRKYDGSVLHLHVSIGVHADEVHKLFTVILHDITERKNAEEELILLNTLMKAVHKFLDLQEVYKVALDMVVSTENVDMAMIYLVDKEKKEAVLQAERNLPEFYIKRAGIIPYPTGITWKVIDSGKVLNIKNAQEDPNIGPAGRELGHKSLLGIPIFLENDVIGVVWFTSYKERKFSEREVRLLSALGDQIALAVARAKMLEEIKTAQEQLIQSEKLASLGQLISSIAHEINNPLTPIIGYSQILLKHPNIDEKMKQSLEVIHSSGQRVVKIIEKLLSFSRKYKPLRIYEDINHLIEQSIEFREYQLKLENIKIEKDLDPELPKTMVDPNQMQQVFTNIILNAEQAMSEAQKHGHLKVRSRLKDKNTMEISFSDDGPGIPKEFVSKVFDPFFTTKDPGKGTGLGLAVAYGIIKEHGGKIHVSSKEEKGTTFVIELPVLEREAVLRRDEENKIPEPPNTVKGKRILIVEDEEIVINLIKGVLEEEDSMVDIARNGKEALKIIGTNQYDLIVCDIRMPQMSGIALYNEVKRMNPDLAHRIIFITGDPSSETIDFINETGNKFITKPFKIEKFKTRINSIFEPHFEKNA